MTVGEVAEPQWWLWRFTITWVPRPACGHPWEDDSMLFPVLVSNC